MVDILGSNSHPVELRQRSDDGHGGGAVQPATFKHIILGIDGTWQAAYQDIFQSNVFKMILALNYDDKNGNPQNAIYSAGVGTANRSSRTIAGATGEGLDELILEAYINLASNYWPGDKIYIFGFSRGAVVARALTAFISYSGLLQANSLSLMQPAWRYFTHPDPNFDFASIKAANTHPNVEIEFLGVWDTVPGPYRREDLRRKYRFDTLRLDRSVKVGVHILSIDESRSAFQPLLWEGTRTEQQIIEQIWMPGVHADIGGGYSEGFFSTLSLVCMIDRLSHHYPELDIDTDYIVEMASSIVEEGRIAINDEWRGYFGRYVKPLVRAYRTVIDEPHHNHRQHPIIELIDGQTISIRGRPKRYTPTIYPRADAKRLASAEFLQGSLYFDKLVAVLKGRFP